MDFEKELQELADKIAQSWRDENLQPEYVRAHYAVSANRLNDMLFDRAVKFYLPRLDRSSTLINN